MAANASNGLNYCVSLPYTYINMLGAIRLWERIKFAVDNEVIWLTQLNYTQINSLEIKQIPFVKIYSIQDNKLFPLNSLLPSGNAPALLYTPIQRALPVELPSENCSALHLNDTIEFTLQTSTYSQEASACIVKLNELENYLENAATVRLSKIKWVQLNNDLAFLIGVPLLPLPGKSYYRKYDFYLPLGFEMKLSLLEEAVNNKINPANDNWVLWQKDNTYSLVSKEALVDLSRSSFQLTKDSLIQNGPS